MKKFSKELKFFSKKLKMKRYENELSQEELAYIIDCHVNALGRLERGQSYPTFIMIIKIARALKISVKDLMPD